MASRLRASGGFCGRVPASLHRRLLSTSSKFTSGASVDFEEVEKFGRLAERWWDPNGPQSMLQLMNPSRIRYIRNRLGLQFSREESSSGSLPLKGLRILDVGCGGGFASESMARLGADVLGLDASEDAIGVAKQHATESGLMGDESSEYKLQYEHGVAEYLAEQKMQFDVVTALDIIEHVPEQTPFLCTCLSLVKPGGAMFVSTLNRTPLSYSLAIVAAEYVLRYVPTETHDWNKFVTPDELQAMVSHYEDYEVLNSLASSEEDTAAIALEDMSGIKYNPLKRRWGLDPNDLEVNYIAHISKR
eukprot:jgi/Bigna1/146362/aug1.113_g21070